MRFIPRPVIDQQYPRDAEHSYGQRDPEGAADRPHRYISVHAINPICDSFPKTKHGAGHGSPLRCAQNRPAAGTFCCFDFIAQRDSRGTRATARADAGHRRPGAISLIAGAKCRMSFANELADST
jgi:hypothetical protein